jgi:membrane-bound lytic murein transglycosylase D
MCRLKIFVSLIGIQLISMAWLDCHAQTDSVACAPTDSIFVEAFMPDADLLTIPADIIRARLPKLEQRIPLTYNQYVQKYVDILTFKKPTYTRTVLGRVPMFFPLYERLLKQYNLPEEFKYLSVVESGLNPKALSHAGAVGLWQFMPGTGRDLRLYQDSYIDERMEPVKATEAACKYLRDLYRIFGDWELAMAAYNAGPGTIKRAMRRSGGQTFYEIYDFLPKETRGYVPLFVAHVYLLNHANDHGLVADNMDYPIPFDTIQVNNYLDLSALARHGSIPLATIQKLNPAITTTILPVHTRNFMLRLPLDGLDYFAENRQMIMDSASKQPVIPVMLASARNPLDTSAKRLGVLLVGANRLPIAANDVPPVTATPGKLDAATSARIAAEATAAANGETLESPAPTLREEPKKMAVAAVKTPVVRQKQHVEKPHYHTVQKGDTLWSIAQRYGKLSIEELKRLNKIRGNDVKRGQRLRVG